MYEIHDKFRVSTPQAHTSYIYLETRGSVEGSAIVRWQHTRYGVGAMELNSVHECANP